MNRILLFSMGVMLATICGCASQTKNTMVGEPEVKFDCNNRMDSKSYAFHTSRVEVVFASQPTGALVEWNDGRGQWIAVGSTPMENVAIEATGKPELFRISQEGYLPQIRWVKTQANIEKMNIEINLVKDITPNREYLGEGS
ncbi:MAG: hypothetical protein V3V10_10580 [Planctomycetota bacterium]